MINKIKKQLIKHEGMVCSLYKCSQNKFTIGVGRNLEDNGITESEAIYLLENDIKRVMQRLDGLWKVWRTFPEPAQIVCIDIAFNCGVQSWMGFRKTRAYMELGEWEKASKELLNSKYANQVGPRALFNSEELRKCQQKLLKTTRQIQD